MPCACLRSAGHRPVVQPGGLGDDGLGIAPLAVAPVAVNLVKSLFGGRPRTPSGCLVHIAQDEAALVDQLAAAGDIAGLRARVAARANTPWGTAWCPETIQIANQRIAELTARAAAPAPAVVQRPPVRSAADQALQLVQEQPAVQQAVTSLAQRVARQPLVRQAAAEFVRESAAQPEVQAAAAGAAAGAAQDFFAKHKVAIVGVAVGAVGLALAPRLLRRRR